MTNYFTDVVCRAHNVDRATFIAVCGDVAAALYVLDGGAGASFSTSPSTFTVTFGFTINARSKREAEAKADVIARTALHASGGATVDWPEPDWPDDFEKVDGSARTLREMVAV